MTAQENSIDLSQYNINDVAEIIYNPSYEELYDYLNKIGKEEYNVYIGNIKEYLKSEQIKFYDSKWASKYFVKKTLSKYDH